MLENLTLLIFTFFGVVFTLNLVVLSLEVYIQIVEYHHQMLHESILVEETR